MGAALPPFSGKSRLLLPGAIASEQIADLLGSLDASSRPNIDGACFGDSRARNNWYGTTIPASPSSSMFATGFAFWLQTISGARVRLTEANNLGVSGDTTAQMVARLSSALTLPVSFYVILGSINDRTTGMTALDSITNLTTIIQAMLALRRRVYIVNELINTALSGTQLAYHSRVRAWIKTVVAFWPGVRVVDPLEDMADITGTVPAYLSFMSRDGLHLTPRGAYYVGKALARALIKDFPSIDWLPHQNFETYSTFNPSGNLCNNGMFKGTTGTLSGTAPTPTGQVADGWTVAGSNGTGLTIAASKVAGQQIEMLDRSGLNPNRLLQQIVVGGTPTTAFGAAELRYLMSAANLTAGDTIEAFAYVEVDAGATGLTGLQFDTRIQDTVPTSFAASAGGQWPETNDYFMPAEAWSGIVRTPRLLVPANANDFRVRLFATGKQNSAISATVRIGCVGVSKVPA